MATADGAGPDFDLSRVEAVDLAHIEHPAAEGERAPPLIVAHGLFGSARNFNTLGRRLARHRRVILLDMRNHGASPWAATMDYPSMAADIARAVERLAGGRAVVMGHSMGGKAAMVLALARPELLAGLAVIDIAPVAYGHDHAGVVAALRGLDLGRVRRRSEADPLLAPRIPEAELRAFLLQNLVLGEAGAAWRINLDAIAANMPHLVGFPEPPAGAHYGGPALFLHGTASPYVTPAMYPRIRALFPAAEIETIEGAGHWLHAERPAEFLAHVEGWLERHAAGD